MLHGLLLRSQAVLARHLAGVVRLALAALALALSAAANAQALTTLTSAQARVAIDGQPTQTLELKLPLHWDALTRGAAGHATLVFDVPVAADADHALLFTRLGNTYKVHLNGRLIEEQGRAGNPYDDHSKQPRLVRLPAALLQPQNRIEIHIDAQAVRKAGVSPALFGTADAVMPTYESLTRWRVSGLLVVAIASAILGGLALLLWIRQRDGLYLVYAAGELLWALSVADTFFDRTPLPWPWWGVLTYSAQALSGMLICKFALVVVERHRGWLRRAVDGVLIASAPLLAIALAGGHPELELLVLLPSQVVGVCVAASVVRHGLLAAELEKRVLAVAMIAIVAVLLRDAFVLVIRPYSGLFDAYATHYGDVAWVRYAWLLFGFVLAWIIAERLRRSAQQLAAFERQIDAKGHQARMEERHRLTRDMHDGLGSQLLGALQLARNHEAPRELLSQQLQEALDQLKLTVDAMQDTEGDIASLLGALRHRLGPRLKAAGVELGWSVEPLPAIEGWTLDHSRDLQMILFEAFANIVSHAGAARAWLRAWHDPAGGGVRIVLRDDGSGIVAAPAETRAGRGLANMRARAARLGARLEIVGAAPGTVVDLTLSSGGAALQ